MAPSQDTPVCGPTSSKGSANCSKRPTGVSQATYRTWSLLRLCLVWEESSHNRNRNTWEVPRSVMASLQKQPSWQRWHTCRHLCWLGPNTAFKRAEAIKILTWSPITFHAFSPPWHCFTSAISAEVRIDSGSVWNLSMFLEKHYLHAYTVYSHAKLIILWKSSIRLLQMV